MTHKLIAASATLVLIAAIVDGCSSKAKPSAPATTPPASSPISSSTASGSSSSTGIAASSPPAQHASSAIEIAANPTGAAFYDGSAWIMTDSAAVLRIDPASNKTIATVGNFPVRATGANGALWVSNCGDGTVSRIDTATNKVQATISTGSCPFDIAALDGSIWVANADDHVSRIDPHTNKVAATVHVPLSGCTDPFQCTFRGLAVGEGAVWVTSSRSTVVRIDPATDKIATVTLGKCCTIVRGIGVGFGYVWAAETGPGIVVRIDPRSLKVTAQIKSSQPGAAEVLVTDDSVWVGHTADSGAVIEVIDPKTTEIVSTVDLGDNTGSMYAEGAGSIWAANYDTMKVYRISP